MHVVLADDHADVRCALAFLLVHEADLQLASEAINAAELLARLECSCPDLVLIDWELPGMSGRDLLTRIWALYPGLKVIALSVRPEARAQALDAGAHDFVSKGDPPERLLAAVRAVLSAGVS